MFKIATFAIMLIALTFNCGCNVDYTTIDHCAKACQSTGTVMQHCTFKECKCFVKQPDVAEKN